MTSCAGLLDGVLGRVHIVKPDGKAEASVQKHTCVLLSCNNKTLTQIKTLCLLTYWHIKEPPTRANKKHTSTKTIDTNTRLIVFNICWFWNLNYNLLRVKQKTQPHMFLFPALPFFFTCKQNELQYFMLLKQGTHTVILYSLSSCFKTL